MDRALRTLSVLALVAAVVEYLVLRSTAEAVATGYSLLVDVAVSMLTTTVFCVCFAAGVVALVAAGLRRQRGWLVALGVLLAATVYGRYVFALDPDLTGLSYAVGGIASLLGAQTIIDVLLPVLMPLGVLLYARALRGRNVDADLLVEQLAAPGTAEEPG